MSWYKSKIKIRPNDKVFSNYIRQRDGWRCQYHFKCYGGESYEENKGALHCSHFQKRRKESVRFDPQNADAACVKCHFFVENDPEGQKVLEAWKLQQLGEKEYKALLIRANITGKRDDFLTKLYLKELIKEYEKAKLKN